MALEREFALGRLGGGALAERSLDVKNVVVEI
jgi:hypothetical protein